MGHLSGATESASVAGECDDGCSHRRVRSFAWCALVSQYNPTLTTRDRLADSDVYTVASLLSFLSWPPRKERGPWQGAVAILRLAHANVRLLWKLQGFRLMFPTRYAVAHRVL